MRWLLWLFALLIGVGCQRGGLRDDDDWLSTAERLASPQEKALRSRAMRALGRGDKMAEAQAWRTLLQTFPKGYFAGLAHIRLGLYAYRKKQWKQAIQHFERSLHHSLSTQERQYILLYHARSLEKLKRDKALLALLKPRYRALPPRQQRSALRLLLRACERLKRPRHAFQWRLKLLRLTHGTDRTQLQRHLLAYIKTLNASQLRTFLQQAKAQNYAFPLDYMAMQMARLLYRQDQYKQAKSTLAALVQKLGISHPLYHPARRLLAEVQEIRHPANPRIIGAILPLSGPGDQIGLLMKNALEIALLDYPQVRIIYKDSRTQPARAAAAVDELVRQDKAIAIFGPPLPRQAWAAAKRAQTLGVPLISITVREKFPDIGSFIFRNNLTLSMMGHAVARYAYNRLRIKRFGVLYPGSKYGRIQAQAYLQELQKLGATLTSAIEYPPETKDFQLYVKLLLGTTYENAHLLHLAQSQLKGLQPYQKKRLRRKIEKMLQPLVPFEGLFIPEQAKITAQIAAYLSYYNVRLKRPSLGHVPMFFSPLTHFRKIQLLGNNNWFHKDLFQAGAKYVRGGILCVRFYPGSYRTANQNFVQLYQRTYNKPPIHITAYAYDAMRLMAHLLSTGKVRTRPQLRRALLQIKGFEGPTGPLRVQPNGEIVGPIHFLMAYKGRFRLHGTLP